MDIDSAGYWLPQICRASGRKVWLLSYFLLLSTHAELLLSCTVPCEYVGRGLIFMSTAEERGTDRTNFYGSQVEG